MTIQVQHSFKTNHGNWKPKKIINITDDALLHPILVEEQWSEIILKDTSGYMYHYKKIKVITS